MDNDNERLEAQYAEMARQNKFMKFILDSAAMVFLLLDRECKLVYCSENVKKYVMLSDLSEIIGKPLTSLERYIDDKAFARRFYDNIMRVAKCADAPGAPGAPAADAFVADVAIAWPNGVKRLYRTENRRITGEGGVFDGVSCVMRDITEIKAKEAEAREIDERVRIMFDSTPMICIMRDENNRIIDCNRAALDIFGFSGKAEFIREFDNKFHYEAGEGVRSTKSLIDGLEMYGHVTAERTLVIKYGERLPIETTFVKIPWKESFRIISYSRDLREVKANERKVLESAESNRKLQLQKEAAQVASEAKSKYLASMSHEIRTPMNTILGLLDLLRTDNLTGEQLSNINDIKSMSEALLQIINDILDFHKIEAGKIDILPVSYDIRSLYSDLVSRHKFLAEAKRLVFKHSFSPDLPHYLFGDEIRISQIVTNMLSNAIKYTRKGYIRFDVGKVADGGAESVLFTVEDTGIGIKEDNLATVFKEFEQFDTRKNRGVTGTGLGLAIAKRLTALMNGTITCESAYGKGSVFTLALPLVEGSETRAQRKDGFKMVRASPETKALLVDDNPGNIIVALGLLARHGIMPQTAGTGLEAVEMVKAGQYDIVFMDHMMPEMDGVEATIAIRAMGGGYYKKLPVIALTANVVADAKRSFLEAGMNDFVSKPIDVAELNRVLKKWLPPEKIVNEYNAYSDGARGAEPDLDKMLGGLSKIDHLSVIKGLSQLDGDTQLYIDVIWQFCLNAEEDAADVVRFAKEGRWSDFTVKVHALRTVFANIGNQYMSDWARNLENAAIQGEVDKCADEADFFYVEMMDFYTSLCDTELMNDFSVNYIKKKIPRAEAEDMLKRLRAACYEFNAAEAESIADDLCKTTYTPEYDAAVKRLQTLIKSFDYDDAVSFIDSLTL